MGLRILEVLRLQWAEVGADRIWIRGAVKNRYSERVLPLPAIVGGLLAEVRRSEARVVTAWTDRIAYSKVLHNALCVTFGLQAPEPRGLRRTLSMEAEINGWSGYPVERYLLARCGRWRWWSWRAAAS